MEEKLRLEISGLSYSQTQTGAYALVLSEVEGNRSLPIIIGNFEAQAIAIELEQMKPSRPLTHDVFKSFADEFGIKLLEVVIYNLVEGVFYAKIKCLKDDIIHEIDARTSDAIALAVRFNCPIYTNKTIIDTAGITIEDEEQAAPEQADSDEDILSNIGESTDYSTMEIVELEALLAEAIQQEDYHRAALLRDEINRRKS